MENKERIVVACEGNTIETMDWAQGITLHKKALKRGKKKGKKLAVKPLSSHIQSQFVAGSMFTVFIVVYLYVTRHIPSFVRTAVAAYIIGLVILHFSLGFSLRKAMHQIRQKYREKHTGGDIIFDSFGIEDRELSGKTVRLSWSEYELCVITNQVITMLLGHMLYVIPYTDEVSRQIVQALGTFGKADTVIDCRRA